MPARVNMFFHSGNTHSPLLTNLSSIVSKSKTAAPRPSGLGTSMIDRVHRAKPGCSACGKKVA